MIPNRKKTPEEIAALREGLGIPGSSEKKQAVPTPPPTPPPVAEPIAPPQAVEPAAPPEPDALPNPDEPVLHLDPPQVSPVKAVPHSHSLRKHEPPLAPAPPVTHKTSLPTHRHDPRDVAQIRKREALAKLNNPGLDPAAHLRRQTAQPLLYVPGYLLAAAAFVVVLKRVHHITPIVLLALSLSIIIYIAIRKPRSRHHAALIFIIAFIAAVLGGIYYAPLFQHGP